MGSALTVSLKSCRGEPTIKEGGGSCAPVGGVCLSQRLGVDIKKESASMLHLGGSSKSGRRLEKKSNREGAHRSEDTWMDKKILQSELSCQPVRGISACKWGIQRPNR